MKRVNVKGLSLALVIALLGASICCPAVFAAGEGADGIDEVIAGMSLRDKLAQMMFFSPRTWKDDPESEEKAENVTALNDALTEFITSRRFGGFLLFGENCADAEQVLRLTAEMKAATLGGGGVMPLVAVDQEGGTVARLSFGTTGVGNMALAATGDPACAREMAGVYGEELKLLGIDVNFAPVMDVNDNPANPIIGIRSFGDDAQAVSQYGLAYMEGLREKGVVACVKHFPGHGNTDTDSHTGLPLVDRSHDELMANELVPFKAAVDGGVDMVMTAHIQFPQVETQTYTSASGGEEIFLPATTSRTILTGILRGELGFEGVIVSDALDMQAIADNFAPDDMLTLCINAGVNMLIMPPVWDAGSLDRIDDLLDRAVALTEAGTIDIERVDDSVRRILALKQKYGLLDATSVEITEEQVTAAVEGCGSAEHRQIAWDIAVKALTLLKNENDAFPLDVQAGEKTLVLFSAASRAGAGELSAQLLSDMGALPEGASIESMVIEPDTAEACVAAAKEADHVLLVSRAWAADCLDPTTENGFPVGIINQVIDDLHAAGKTAIVISAQLPYDAACFPDADAILLTYGSSVMRGVPNASGAGSAWAPNLPAAICAAFGAAEPAGVLPVIIPPLDESDALAEPSDTLKSVYDALVNGSAFRNTQAVSAEHLEETFEASLEGNAITFTETSKDGDSKSWTFVQEGDWLTAPLGDEEDNSRGKAYLLLGAAVAAQGVNTDLFFGYINAVKELQSKVWTYDESDGEKKIRINIVGPYEYDLDALDTLAPSEEYLREEGWAPLGEDYEALDSYYGKIKMNCVGNADGLAISVREYGALDELALKAVVSAASILQPGGWDDFVAGYTELKDADEAGYTAILNPDEASSEDLYVFFQDGYSSAYFFIGQPWDWED